MAAFQAIQPNSHLAREGKLLLAAFTFPFQSFFGPSVEQRIGKVEFVRFYLIAAVVGGVVHSLVLLATGSPLPMLGASGAVTAIVWR